MQSAFGLLLSGRRKLFVAKEPRRVILKINQSD